MENHIFIYNDIGKDSEETSLADVKAQYNPASTHVIVHINSNGGDVNEGRAIYDFLREIPQDVKTVGEGMVASIATLPFLAGNEREMKPNAEFLGHLPSMRLEGNSDEIEKGNSYIQEKKQDIAKVYSETTGASVEEMVEFMRLDTPITAEIAKGKGFATTIPEFKAVAHYNLKKEKMEDVKVKDETKLEKIHGKLMSSIDNLIGVMTTKAEVLAPVNVNVELEDGTMFYVDSEDGEFEGKEVFTVDAEGNRTEEKAPAGTHVLTDGRSITIEDGVVTSVQEVEAAEPEEVVEDSTLKLQNEIAELKVQLEAKNLESTAKALELEAKNSETKVLTDKMEALESGYQEVITNVKAIQSMTAGGEPVIAKANIKPTNKSNTSGVVNGAGLGGWAKNFVTH